MKNLLVRVSIILFSVLAVVYPVWFRIKGLSWAPGYFYANLFPLLGILAFSIMWLHVTGGAFEPWLKKYVDFERFVRLTSSLVFILILLHPLLLLVNIGFNLKKLTLYEMDDVVLGLVGLALLLTYDIGKFMKQKDFFIRHWNKILILSTIGFLVIFFHSLALGSDLQAGFLRQLWIFYGITGALAAIWNYGLRRFLSTEPI